MTFTTFRNCLLPLLTGLVTSVGLNAATPEITFEPYQFEASDGTTVAAERGIYKVSENRNNPNARDIELQFVRFKSTSDNPGSPIIYLAGGPGGSGVGTARGRRFPLFMAMREFGDVIAFDQRGTGWSNHIPECQTEYRFPLDQPLSIEHSIPVLRQAADECSAFWKAQGVDLAGYNTLESARDIETLRHALGSEKLSLWGISYGSHLAMAVLKVMPNDIERMVLTGIEGLDATVKLPARTDAYFQRLQATINNDPSAAKAFPDLAGLMRSVHAQLDSQPIETTFTDSSGETVTMTIGKLEMQLVGSFSIADPASAARLPALYAMAAAGDLSRIAPFIYENLRRDAVSFDGMSEAMDIMSGISTQRLTLVRQQAESSLLGDLLNFPMPHLAGAFGLSDLGDKFRQPVKTNAPTLILSSTLDGRTYPKAAAEAISGPAVQMVVVENGGHNVFMQAPEISDIILRFMRGETIPKKVTLEPPKFLY